MNLASAAPEEMMSIAAEAVIGRTTDDLDLLATPIYATDREGRITYFNPACVEFSGRTPITGADRWCVSWKLYAGDGTDLPHDQCPMAVAIREKRPIRGVEAIAERPDGTRVRFLPFPTPLIDELGEISGAVNMLLDVTDQEQANYLKGQADRCRRLAKAIGDQPTINTLKGMADDYDRKARALHSLN